MRTVLPQLGHSLTGASVKDCTTSNSCLPSGLVQAYWYVGTAAELLVRTVRAGTRARRLLMMRLGALSVQQLSASVTFALREGRNATAS